MRGTLLPEVRHGKVLSIYFPGIVDTCRDLCFAEVSWLLLMKRFLRAFTTCRFCIMLLRSHWVEFVSWVLVTISSLERGRWNCLWLDFTVGLSGCQRWRWGAKIYVLWLTDN
jgi:hypothetical protein